MGLAGFAFGVAERVYKGGKYVSGIMTTLRLIFSLSVEPSIGWWWGGKCFCNPSYKNGPFELAWWLILVIFYPIRLIVNIFRGVKTKKDGSRDKRYKDKDEDDEDEDEDK